MRIRELISAIEEAAPLSLQESYDNAGLIIGDIDRETESAIITLDVTEPVIQETIELGAKLIIAHHPLIFSGIKRFNGYKPVERMVASCLKHDIAVYAAHTNLDNIQGGVNAMICEKLGIKNPAILTSKPMLLRKLVTFCPLTHADIVRKAIFDAGAGHIGNYDSCSYNISGQGTFRALEGADPFVGEKGELHVEDESRIESIYPVYREKQIISALLQAHPYEEVAFDIYNLANTLHNVGAGMIGNLEAAEKTLDLLKRVKDTFGAGCVKHTRIIKDKIFRIAVCGGSGSFLLQDAIAAGAELFITGDVKYHDFFEADEKIVIADIGHYESEQFTKELLVNMIKKKYTTFAARISKYNTNPVQYL